jgi:hypothetical protein
VIAICSGKRPILIALVVTLFVAVSITETLPPLNGPELTTYARLPSGLSAIELEKGPTSIALTATLLVLVSITETAPRIWEVTAPF